MFYSAKLAIVIAATMVLSLATVLCGLFDAHGKRVYRINQFWTWLIVKFSGIALTVDGLDRLDPRRQYLFIVNHQSNFDIPVLVQSIAAVPAPLDRQERASLDTFLRLGDVGGETYHRGSGGFVGRA